MSNLDSLPRPSIPGALLGAEYWFRPERFLLRCEKLGDRFQLPLPGLPPTVAVTSPADIRAVFTGDQSALHFGEGLKKLAPHELLLGSTSITVKDGEAHLRDRRMLNPHFAGERLTAYVPTMTEKTRAALRDWPIGHTTAFHPLMMHLTLEIIIAVIFGVSDPGRTARMRSAVLELVGVIGGKRFMLTTIVAVARGGRWDGRHRRIRAAIESVDRVVREEMAERHDREDFARNDLLAVFIGLQKEHGSDVMSDLAICEAMRTMLIAGYETTATSLAWIVERMVRVPQVLEKLEESVDRGDDAYIDAVIAEGMRVRTVAPHTTRYVVKPFDLGELHLEPGTMILPMIALLHRRADIYPEPLLFRPERFLGTKPKNFEWIPFGGGVRKCLGGPFALLEMRVILRTILQELRFEPTDAPDEPIGRRNVTWVPGRGARVVLKRRTD